VEQEGNWPPEEEEEEEETQKEQRTEFFLSFIFIGYSMMYDIGIKVRIGSAYRYRLQIRGYI
jgi:hypothetical protein